MIIRESTTRLVLEILSHQVLLISVLGIVNLADHVTPFYDQFNHSQSLSIGAISLILSVVALISIVAFKALQWTNNYYELRNGIIIIKKGILSKTNIEVPLNEIKSLEYSSSAIGRILKYGSILIHTGNNRKELKIENIPEVAEFFKKLKSQKSIHKFKSINKNTVEKLLHEEESDQLELKSSLRWDYKSQKVNKDLEKAVLKTIVGFLNNIGGILIIGVDDAGTILGLEKDYQSLPKSNFDGFENHFTQIFGELIGIEHRFLVKLHVVKINEKEVVAMEVSQSKEPVYLKYNGIEEFYLRTGNNTSLLSVGEILSYLKLHNKL